MAACDDKTGRAMDWLAQVDGYCERLGPGYWAEPLNALSNLAFVLAAVLVWPRVRAVPQARLMVAALAAIGAGSWLFHTHANRLTAMTDVIPIAGFILIYVFAATRDLLGQRTAVAFLAALAFLPYAALTVPLWSRVPGLGSSAGYAPVPVLIGLYAALLWRRAPRTARGLAAGAGLLVVSLFFRTIDGPVCATLPTGTHFIWHLLNAAMLAHMIVTYARHVVAGHGRRALEAGKGGR